ncbi:MAG: hypothetical protein F4X55_05710 [Candidatus Dadabacteria bacterium]|nr:hypothetical protein [Candidatus Dadabacteria bacterium]MYC40489.1 hypothetical protein [Candidatus Dadabacteria bacterium]
MPFRRLFISGAGLMDAEKIFYGIDEGKKRRYPRRPILIAVLLALGLGAFKFGLYPEQWFWESDGISRKLIVRNMESQWISTKKGYLFFVRGEIMNESDVPVSYIKLRSSFQVSGRTVYVQDFYSGNTLSIRDLRNADTDHPLQKLNRKSGDDLSALTGTGASANVNIKPGNTVFFNTFYLSVNKILGLKYEIEITDFEVMSEG